MPRADYRKSPPELKRLGATLRELRISAGLRQADLAAETGMTESQISALECGRNNPGWLLVVRFLRGVDRDLADLAYGYGDLEG